MKRSIVPITVAFLAVLLIGLLVYGVVGKKTNDSLDEAVRAGKKPAAPGVSVRLPNLDGQGTSGLADLGGKVVVLNFWASWCEPCKAEAPRLEAAWNQFRGKGVIVIGVDAQDFSGDARKFMRRHGVTYPNVHDGPGNVLPKYGVTGFPETYFVGRDGKLVGERVQGEISAAKLLGGIRRALKT